MQINEIATLAAKSRKPNRACAFHTICEAVENDGRLSQDDLAGLYRFFMPSATKPKTVFDWVYKAVSKEETRYYLQFVYADNRTMVATDGHRLHYAPTDLENGYYDAAGNKVDVDLNYPDWRRIVPSLEYGVPHETWDRDSAVVEHMEISGKAVGVYKLSNGTLVNKAYWDDMTVGLDSVEYYQEQPESPVLVSIGIGKAGVIMPRRR